MTPEGDPWRSPRPRLMEALRAMRAHEEGRLRDLLVLGVCAGVFVALLLYL